MEKSTRKLSRHRLTTNPSHTSRKKPKMDELESCTIKPRTNECASENKNQNIDNIKRVILEISKLYTAVWSNLTKFSTETVPEEFDIKEFANELSQLREYFVCPVCQNLVSEEFKITSSPSEHCSSFHLACDVCRDMEWAVTCERHSSQQPDLDENETQYLELVLDSYKEFCALFIQFEEFQALVEEKSKTNSSFDAFLLIERLSEGALAAVNTTHLTDDSDAEISNEADPESDEESFSLEVEDISVKPKRSRVQLAEDSSKHNIEMFEVGDNALTCTSSLLTSSVSSPPTPPESVEDTATYVRPLSSSRKERDQKKVLIPNGSTKPANEVSTKSHRLSEKSCRCGSGTIIPGKLTCCGQRCACYAERRVCIDCKCKGCRNPKGKRSLLQSRYVQSIEPQLTTKELTAVEPKPSGSATTNFKERSRITGSTTTFSPAESEDHITSSYTSPPRLSPISPVKQPRIKKPSPSPPNLFSSKC